MKILVTGGAGFIGSHVVDLLIKKGHDISIIDNLSTGKKENLNKDAKFYKADIKSKFVEGIFKKEKFDVIVHHAAQINVRKSILDPVFDAENNILGSLNIIALSKKYNIKKMLYASSGGACYGEPVYLPCDEKHPVNPICPYGVSKYAVELYLNQSGVKHCILRYGNVYGPRQDPLGEAGVIAMFTNKIMKNKIPVVFGDGKQTRDFVYVEDVAKANLLALEKEGTFNIGTGKKISVNEVYAALKKFSDYNGGKIHAKPIAGEVKHIYLGISKAKQLLGWEPAVNFEEGIKKTIKWYKECYQL